YVHVVRGVVDIGSGPSRAGARAERLAAGDAARITDARELEARGAGVAAELLMWEMRAEPDYG
ncbi:MAG: hypothetical protein ACRDOV_11850, partial [Streptomyces sp.]